MNVSSSDLSSSLSALLASQSQSSTSTQQSSLAAALLGTDSTDSTDSSSSDLSALFDSSSSNSTLMSSGLQNAASFIQASQTSLTSISSVLSQMSALQKDATSSGATSTQVAADQKSFDTLRDQLRSDIGGSTSEIGGTTDVTGTDSLNGQPLFGSNAASFTIGTGLTSAPTMTVNGVNLRQGPVQGLLEQDSSGAYTTSITDSGTASAIADAQQQVHAGASTLTHSDSILSATLATLQIQSTNMASALDAVQNDSSLAQYSITGQSSSALSSQANLDPSDVMSLLQA